MKKILLSAGIMIGVLVVGFVAYFYISLKRSPIGPPDSFINANECTIQKNENDENLNNVFTAHCATIIYPIANSEENLDTYIGEKVRIQAIYPKNTSGNDSVQSNTQCIAETCQPIYKDNRNVYAIVIQKIEEL
jgi:hypothetical protein